MKEKERIEVDEPVRDRMIEFKCFGELGNRMEEVQ